MSTTIDSKVVEMKFDNRNFENNIQTSLSTLDKLKKGLNLNGATKGIDNIGTAIKNCSVSGLTSAVETVRTRFSALEVMAVTALANIANSAVNAGKRMLSALTIDPIKTGFQEYETQINAVQTILANTASKGTTLNQVNAALDELNTYADKTIYNFTEMTRNIGTFTAAGVDLNTSVDAIKGIANLAAVSGSTSQQASTAMYQLSQALSSGTVKLMDWNSVVNAGMGGQVFQDSLKETARLHGIAIDDMITKQGSFRETLQEGWLSAEILTETLSKFTGDLSETQLKQMGYTEEQIKEIIELGQMASDAATKVKTFTQLWDTLKESAQSGWSQSWKIIVGDFEEAKELFTGISEVLGNMIGKSADARNELLLGSLGTGWDQLLKKGIADEVGYKEAINKTMAAKGKSLKQLIDERKAMAKANGESISDEKAFQDVLKSGAVTSDILTKSLSDLADKTRGLSDEQLEELGYTRDQIDALEKLENEVKNGTVSLRGFANMMGEVSGREKLIKSLYNAFEGIMNVINPIKEAFSQVFPPVTVNQLRAFVDGLQRITEKFKEITAAYGPKITSTFKGLFSILNIVKQAFSAVFNAIKPLLGKVGELGGGILEATASWGEWLFALSKSIEETNFFGGIIQNIIDFVKKAAVAVFDFFMAFKEKFQSPALETIQSFFERIGSRFIQIKDAANDMKIGILGPIAAIGASLANSKMLSGLEKLWNGMKVIVKGIVQVLGNLIGGLIDNLGNANFDGIFDLINGGIFTAIGVGIAKFINKLTDIAKDGQGFIGGLKNIKDAVLDTFGAFQESLKAETLKKIAIAIAILAASLFVLSLIDSDKLSSALGAITILFPELMGSMAVFNKISGGGDKGLVKLAASMIAISVAILLLSFALKTISGLKFGELVTGLFGVAALAGIVVGTSKLLSSGKGKIANGAAQMILFAVAIKILASACKDLSALSWESLAKGLSGIGILFAEMAGFTKLMGDSKNMISMGVGMIAIATSMKILASALDNFAVLQWDEIQRGLVAMGGALVMVALAVNGMPKNMVGIGIGLIAVSTALLIMSSALSNFGGMNLDEIKRGLIALGGAMLILAIGLNAMNGTLGGSAAMVIAIIALSALVPILTALGSMSWESIAKGLVAIAGAFAIMGIAGLVLGPLVPIILGLTGAFALFGLGILSIGAGLILAGLGLTAIAAGIGAIATAGAAGATALVAALTVIITGIVGLIPLVIQKLGEGIVSFCKTIGGSAEAIGSAVKSVILSLVSTLVECVPALVNGALIMISELLTSLVEHGPMIVEKLFSFLLIVLDGLITYGPELVGKLISFIIVLINGIAERIPEIIQAAVNLIGSILQGIADAIGPLIDAVVGPLIQIVTDSIEKIISVFSTLVSYISPIIDSITSLITQLGDSISEIFESISSVITVCGETIGSVFSGIGDVIESVGTSIKSVLDGIAGIIDSIGNAALNAGSGFQNLANGVKTITELNIIDMTASMGAVAIAIAGIAASSFGIASIATNLQQMTDNAASSEASFTIMASKISTIISAMTSLGLVSNTAVAQLTAAVNGTSACFYALTTVVKSTSYVLISAFSSMITTITEAITNKYWTFRSSGQALVMNLISGVKAKGPALISSFTSSLGDALTGTRNYYNSFRLAGKYVVEGFANGINAYAYLAVNAGKNMAKETLKAVQNTIDSASPSKETYKLGCYFGAGFVNGILNFVALTHKTGEKLAESAKTGLGNAITKISDMVANGIDTRPTIRPVLDLSNVEAGTSRLNALFSRDQALSINAGMSKVDSISENQNGDSNRSGNTYSFTQNNYSPKALSRLDVYRQTKNQFAAMKGLVDA